MSDYKRFTVAKKGDITIVRLVDKELSHLLFQDEFFEEMMRLVDEEKPAKVLLDFEVVDYCNTGIINTLISAKKRVKDQGGEFKLCGLSPHVHAAFQALNLESTVFDVYPTVDEGLTGFAD